MRISLVSSSFFLSGVGELIGCVQLASARNGVGPAFMEGMTAAKPLQPEPDTLRRPVDFDSLTHVFRAGRMEAAGGGEKWRDQELVTSEEESDKLANAF